MPRRTSIPRKTKYEVVPANRIPAGCERLSTDMLSLVQLEQPALDAIVASVPGQAGNVQAAQKAFHHRAQMNGLAAQGKWSADLEKKAA